MCVFLLLSGKVRYVPQEAHVRVHQIWMGNRTENPKVGTYSAQDMMIIERDIGRGPWPAWQAIEQSARQRPHGWISPRCRPSQSASELLAEAGFAWHDDTFNSDLPYQLKTPAGTLMAVPFTMEVNDMPLDIRYGNELEAFTHVLQRP